MTRTKRIVFTGITGYVDAPFAVSGGTSPDDALAEVTTLLSAVQQTLDEISESCGSLGDVIGGCVFMLHAAAALTESVMRARKGEECEGL